MPTFYYNPVVLAEIYAGAFKREIDKIEAFFTKLENIDIVNTQASKWENMQININKVYNNISLEDYLIAANGKINSCRIWTNNTKHYPMNDIQLV